MACIISCKYIPLLWAYNMRSRYCCLPLLSLSILSLIACKIYPCRLCPAAVAAAFIASASGVNGFMFICVHLALYLSFVIRFFGLIAIIIPSLLVIVKLYTKNIKHDTGHFSQTLYRVFVYLYKLHGIGLINSPVPCYYAITANNTSRKTTDRKRKSMGTLKTE